MTEETYIKGKAKKSHLSSIFGSRADSPTNTNGDLGDLNSSSNKEALLNAQSIEAVADDPATLNVDESVIGDRREAAVYWYDSDVSNADNDVLVNLDYSGAPSFNEADYTGPNATIKSPYGPNLNIPSNINDTTIGAFTATLDNAVLVIPEKFNPTSDRFGTNKARSKNINSNGSLRGPGQDAEDIKRRALNPQLPLPDRATRDPEPAQ